MTKAVIVFSGFNQRAVIAFLRTVKNTKTKCAVIAINREDPVFSTDYARLVMSIRKNTALDLEDILNCLKDVKKKIKADSYIIAPSSEALNRFFLEHRNAIRKLDCEIPLVDKRLYETISNKHSFGKLCAASGILIPEEYKSISDAEYPFVAKPKKYFSKRGNAYTPTLITTKSELQLFENEYDKTSFYYQKFIGGNSYYLLYYFYKDGDIVKFSQINRIQQPEGKSIIGAESSNFHLTEESKKYEKMFKRIGFFGLVMVEVKRLKNKNYMIEANPRFWGPSQLFIDARINLFEAFLFDTGLINEKPQDNTNIQKPVKYFWHGGVVDTLSKKANLTFYGYSAKRYSARFSEWIAVDVYNRIDTKKLYQKEVEV